MESENCRMDKNDLDIEYVREKRKQIIDSMMSNGTPKDIKETQTILVALSDMDRTSLSKKKLKVDNNNSNTQIHAMELIASIFNNSSIKNIGKFPDNTNRVIPQLSKEIDNSDILDGETSNLTGAEDYETFMRKMN